MKLPAEPLSFVVQRLNEHSKGDEGRALAKES